MAGHSKWKNIRIRKGKQDAIRGKVFTKLGREIIVATKAGGADPSTNLRLRAAMEKAREASMPKENIDRAVARGSGEIEGADFEELTYEGVGPGGVAVMVDVYSENRNRTVSDLRHAFSKCGGALTENGSVSWQFRHCGQFFVSTEGVDEDVLTLAALDAGADDVQVDPENEAYVVYTPVENLHACEAALREQGIETRDSGLARVPTNMANPNEADLEKLVRLLDMLEELDDVKETYINTEIPEAMLSEM